MTRKSPDYKVKVVEESFRLDQDARLTHEDLSYPPENSTTQKEEVTVSSPPKPSPAKGSAKSVGGESKGR